MNGRDAARCGARGCRRVKCLRGLLLGLCGWLTGAQAQSAQSAPIRVGLIGYLGRPLELMLRDDKANPDAGRAAAEDLLLKENVAFTVGFATPAWR